MSLNAKQSLILLRWLDGGFRQATGQGRKESVKNELCPLRPLFHVYNKRLSNLLAEHPCQNAMSENQNEASKKEIRPQPKKGDFPFPLMDGETESKYLTWVRNHSSFLTVGGFLGGMQAGAAYVRGVIGNLIILMPILLPIGIILGLLHFYLVEWPLLISQVSLSLGLVFTLLYFGYDIGKNFVSRHGAQSKSAVQTFTWFWLKLREHFIAWVMIAIGVLLLVDLSPHIIEFVRKHYVLKDFGLKECAAAVFAGISSAAALIRYMPKSDKFQIQFFVLLIGVLSFVIVWGVTLRIANYVYYGVPPVDPLTWVPLICVFIILGAAVVATWNASVPEKLFYFKKPRTYFALLLPLVVLGLAALACVAFIKHQTRHSGEAIGTITRPLARVVNGFGDLPEDDNSPEGVFLKELKVRKTSLDENAPTEIKSPDRIGWVEGLTTSTNFPPEHYLAASQFLEQFETLSDSNSQSKTRLLRMLSNTATREIGDKVNATAKTGEVELQSLLLPIAIVGEKDIQWHNLPNNPIAISGKELVSWLDVMPDLESIRTLVSKKRIPLSLANEYLKLVPAHDESAEDYKGKSAPDFALSGPRNFSKETLQDDKLIDAVKKVNLRRLLESLSLTDADLVVAKIDSQWFEKCGAKKEEFISFGKIEDDIPFVQIVASVVTDEENVNADGILRHVVANYSGEQSSDGEPLTNAGDRMKSVLRRKLLFAALNPEDKNRELAAYVIGELFDPSIPFEAELNGGTAKSREGIAKAMYRRIPGTGFSQNEFAEMLSAKFIFDDMQSPQQADRVLRRAVHGKYGNLKGLNKVGIKLFWHTVLGRLTLLTVVFASLILFCWMFVDPNATSVHGFYRHRLANAFVLSHNAKNEVVPEQNVLLSHLCNYDEGKSAAPYHLINAALNMQGSDVPEIRDRHADFFFFSKLYVGGKQTGFVRTDVIEKTSHKLDAACAMAISAGAASPNMGKYTKAAATFMLTMLNIRLGYWIPNPDSLRTTVASEDENRRKVFTKNEKYVFSEELQEIQKRRVNSGVESRSDLITTVIKNDEFRPTDCKLLGLALSGGGIRSAAVNLGIVQVLEKTDIFKQVDYLSTVSGGGYLGTALSTFMRSESDCSPSPEAMDVLPEPNYTSRKKWRPPFALLYREMVSRLHNKSKFVNVSDGGHIENLGAFELLRRRCEIIIVGEGECDPDGKFPGLATLMRLAEIDLNVKIKFPEGSLDKLWKKPKGEADGRMLTDDKKSDEKQNSKNCETSQHFSVAKITYPKRNGMDVETGYLLYIRSSLTGKEDQVIKSYQRENSAFPHEPTADQLFDEGQFEAYRRLGVQMMNQTLASLKLSDFKSNAEASDKIVVTYETLIKQLSHSVNTQQPSK